MSSSSFESGGQLRKKNCNEWAREFLKVSLFFFIFFFFRRVRRRLSLLSHLPFFPFSWKEIFCEIGENSWKIQGSLTFFFDFLQKFTFCFSFLLCISLLSFPDNMVSYLRFFWSLSVYCQGWEWFAGITVLLLRGHVVPGKVIKRRKKYK